MTLTPSAATHQAQRALGALGLADVKVRSSFAGNTRVRTEIVPRTWHGPAQRAAMLAAVAALPGHLSDAESNAKLTVYREA